MYASSHNEWDPLEHVIIGSATNAHWPERCEIYRKNEETSLWKETPLPAGPVDPLVIRQANVDLWNLGDELLNWANIWEPRKLDFASFDGLYNYCPRDRVLIIGDRVIDVPMTYPTREKEIEALEWMFDNEIVTSDNPMARFDAANVCRLGKDLLYLVSSTGNLEGAKWLQEYLGKDYKVHVLDDIYSGVHIDSTISPVREGLVVLNKDRIKKVPEVFKKWDIIWMGKDDLVHQPFVDYPYASNYIGLNFLTANPENVICDPKQNVLIDNLHKYGINVTGVDLRHSRTLGGGHHCVTLDIVRKK